MLNELAKLNDAQMEAVRSDHPRILCLAGAGTGKTKTMVTRVAKLIRMEVAPENILMLTFTNSAAREQKERLVALLGEEGEKVWAGTFHSWAVREIRRYGQSLGYSPSFSIYDREDTLSIVKSIIDDLQYKVKANDVMDAMDKRNLHNAFIPAGDIQKVVSEYNFRCRQQNAIDLDSLITNLQALLNRDTIRQIMKNQYKYVFVDEMQDTDWRQMTLLNTLGPDNLFVVGDDFQSIYGFRGGDVGIIMGLAQDPEWQTIKLEENYRSTRQIVEPANRLIKHNNQTEKILKAHRDGPAIAIIEEETPEEELDWIAGKCIRLGLEDAGTTAILARTNAQIDDIADKLAYMDIPFAERQRTNDVLRYTEAKKIAKWMEAILNPTDKEAVMAVINWPEETITRRDLLKAEMYHLENDCSLYTALEATGLAPKFIETHKAITELWNDGSLLLLSELIIALTHIETVNTEKGLNNRNYRINELRDHLNAWTWEQREIGNSEAPEAWLEFYKMRMIDSTLLETEEPDGAVQLMTIHGSKGLEFDNVIIMGLNEKSLPLSKGDIEEERRLCYVAMTRAKNRLYMTRSWMRKTWGDNIEEATPSRFLTEI